MAKNDVGHTRLGDKNLAEIMVESARLKRQSAELLRRSAELGERIAELLPGSGTSPRPGASPGAGFVKCVIPPTNDPGKRVSRVKTSNK